MKRIAWFLRAAAPCVAATGLLVFGCKDLGSEVIDPTPNIQLSIQAAGSVLHKPNHEVLHLISVKALLKKIVFADAGSDDSSDVHRGPMIVNLDLNARMTTLDATRIRPGVYDRVRFFLHKPEDDEIPSDPAFRTGSGGDDRYSVVITGLYHDTPFTFTSRESARQELQMGTPLTVPESGIVNLTLKVDPYAWFEDNGLVLDPIVQEKQIDDRIKGSFASAFKDNDRNGDPD